jgi:hypothetical protein
MQYEKVTLLTTAELTEILRNYSNYEEASVKAAFIELDRRGELEDAMAELRHEVKEGKMKLAGLNSAMDSNPELNLSRPKIFRIGTTQQLVFEQRLIAEGIPYYRREGLDVIVPLVNYYFTDEDFGLADKIEMETEDYVQNLPPDKSAKAMKKAGKTFGWIFIFFVVFLIFSLIINWLSK